MADEFYLAVGRDGLEANPQYRLFQDSRRAVTWCNDFAVAHSPTPCTCDNDLSEEGHEYDVTWGEDCIAYVQKLVRKGDEYEPVC